MTLHGKGTIVTGGNTGIGKAMVVALARDGASYITAATVFADGGIMHSRPGSRS
jgi:NAD(P)-dependent dehydrogenase (short-subunit alcohol dehydrogenase family)